MIVFFNKAKINIYFREPFSKHFHSIFFLPGRDPEKKGELYLHTNLKIIILPPGSRLLSIIIISY